MNELRTFENERFGELRTYTDDNGNLWFCARDIAAVLGYSLQNTTNIFGHVPDEWRSINPINTSNDIRRMLTLSEPGLYFFLGRSDKTKALPYQKWVAGEVIPAIRKTGEYRLPDVNPVPAPANSVSGKTSDERINARIQADWPNAMA
jgi:prophage antirepressor-like protein